MSSNPVEPLTFTNLLFLLSNVTFIAIGIFGKPAISIATEIASQIAFKDSENLKYHESYLEFVIINKGNIYIFPLFII